MKIASDIDAAIAYFEQNNYKKSTQVCKNILVKSPDSFNALQILALSLRGQGKLKEALTIFKSLAERNNLHAATFNNIGNIYLDWQEFLQARKYFDIALALDPLMAEAYNNLGLCHVQLKNLDTAENSFRKAISLNDQIADFHKGLGLLLTECGSFHDAIECFIRVLEIDNSYTSSYWDVFIIQLYLHQYQDALDIADLGVMSRTLSEPELCELLVGKAIIFWLHDDIDNVVQAIKLSEKIYNYPNYSSNMSNMIIFHRYIKSLVAVKSKQLDIYQPKQSDVKPLYFIAESHSLSYNNVIVTVNNEEYQIQSYSVLGSKIFHLIDDADNKYQRSLSKLFESMAPKSKVVLAFGEIDCRYNEGILPYCLKSKSNYKIVIDNMILRYVDTLRNISIQCDLDFIIYGVPSPYSKFIEKLAPENQPLFKDIIYYFNRALKIHCEKSSIVFLDVYALTNSHGVSNLQYHLDSNHLSPIAITKLLQ